MKKAFSKDIVEALGKLPSDALHDLSKLVDLLRKETDDSVRKEIIKTINEILQPQLLIVSRKKGIDMKVSGEFGGVEQGDELMQKMLVFRDKLYEDSRVNGRVAKAASTAMFALAGAYFKYNACCILYFCELAYNDLPVPPEAKHQKKVLCPKCQQDIKTP